MDKKEDKNTIFSTPTGEDFWVERAYYAAGQPKDGEPCGHLGCLNHVTHPCEKCGRIAGRSNHVP